MLDFLLDNKEWLFSGLGVLVLSCAISLFTFFHRKHKKKQSTSSKGTLSGDYAWGNDLPHTSEIFYPRPFVYTPHLRIEFPRKSRKIPKTGVDGKHRFESTPVYSLVEQHPDRFVIEIRDLTQYKPYLTWKATGIISGPHNENHSI